MGDYDLEDDDIGLGDEDRHRVNSTKTDWYKGEKGRTDRVAIVYFNSVEMTSLRRALRADPKLAEAQKREVVEQAKLSVAKKLNKSADLLDEVDLLDLTEARFKPVSGYYSKTPGLGYIAAPKGPLSAEDAKVFEKLGERKDYLCTLLVVYPTDREGELTSKEDLIRKFKIMPWRFPAEKYEVIRKINKGLVESNSTVSSVDLSISCTDTGFQKMTITQCGPALYQRNDNFRRLVLTKAIASYKKLSPFREMSVDDLREKLGMSSGGGVVSPGSDLSTEDFTNILNNV